jgi:SAM-dependent methyltransferase
MKNWLYQILIHRITNECYRGSLNYVLNGSRLLDVGIGNGLMLEAFHPLIKAKQLKITGIDIDARYLKHCAGLIRRHRLEGHIDVCRGSAEDYAPPGNGGFDYVLFCLSFMLLRDQPLVLRRVRDWLKPGGEIIFALSLFQKRSHLVDLVKPRLKYLTTIDFGRPTYEEDFFALLRESKLVVKEDRILKNGWFHDQCRMIAVSLQETRVPPANPESGRRSAIKERSAGEERYRANIQSTSP